MDKQFVWKSMDIIWEIIIFKLWHCLLFALYMKESSEFVTSYMYIGQECQRHNSEWAIGLSCSIT